MSIHCSRGICIFQKEIETVDEPITRFSLDLSVTHSSFFKFTITRPCSCLATLLHSFPFPIIHFLFSFPLLLPKSFFLLYFIYFFDLASLFFALFFSFFFFFLLFFSFLEQVVWSLHCLWFAGSDCDCLSLWWMKDYHLVSSSADLLVCERYPLGYRPPLMHTADGRGITIMVLTFLNLRKDSHYCILRCALLFEFWTLDQINWTLPAPRQKWGFFLNRKETPTSKAQRGWRGSISLISPVFRDLKQCLYILNRALFKSIQPEIFAFYFIILPQRV